MGMNCKIVFMGTPDFAVPSLRMLIDNGYDVSDCFTQPDRKAGRGHKIVAPPVKVLAAEHGIPVYQPEKVSADEGVEILRDIKPDVIVTAAYGQILSESVLDVPSYGCINVHASLLPKLRGAAGAVGHNKRRQDDRHNYDVYGEATGRGRYNGAG
jgi:methionyl-tRNA formyltransferase